MISKYQIICHIQLKIVSKQVIIYLSYEILAEGTGFARGNFFLKIWGKNLEKKKNKKNRFFLALNTSQLFGRPAIRNIYRNECLVLL